MPLEFDADRHEYRLDGAILPSVTQVLEDVGIIDYSTLPLAVREEAMARGRRVHSATHYDDEGDLDELTVVDGDMGYIEAWRRFRGETGFEAELIEDRSWNPIYRYAGTRDRRGKFPGGSLALIDLKSGEAPWWVRVQLAAYAAFDERPMRYRRIAVELHADGTYKMYEFPCGTFNRDLNVFLSALTVFYEKSEQRRAA